jgi:hypothetical protein
MPMIPLGYIMLARLSPKRSDIKQKWDGKVPKQSGSSLFYHLMANCEGETASPSRETQPGHYYKGVHISGSAKVHLGDVNNVGGFPLGKCSKGLETLTINSGSENPLNSLPYAAQASFNSYDKQHDPLCLPDTRVDVLQEITSLG